jgi:hypothetical protein
MESQTDWSAAEGQPCDDNIDCTHTDTCQLDMSCAGVAYSCDDNLFCTYDTCTGEPDGCEHTIDANWCLIDEQCVQGDHPTNICSTCDPALSQTQWSDLCFYGFPCDISTNECAANPDFICTSWNGSSKAACAPKCPIEGGAWIPCGSFMDLPIGTEAKCLPHYNTGVAEYACLFLCGPTTNGLVCPTHMECNETYGLCVPK